MKVAIVTGGSSGIGLSIVSALIQHNYKVYFVGSNKQKGESLAHKLDFDNPNRAEYVNLDLSRLKDVFHFAKEFKKHHNRLDLLGNVAGALLPKKEKTIDGFEKTFAVSYLSAFVLSTQLAPLLEQTKGARIVNVAANPKLIFKTVLDFEDLNFNKNYSGIKASTVAIHAKTILTEILSERYCRKFISSRHDSYQLTATYAFYFQDNDADILFLYA